MPGTPKAGYMPPEKGPFKCARCKHLQAHGCDEDEVIDDLGKNQFGLAPVKPEGCCNFFDPKSESQEYKSPLVKLGYSGKRGTR